MKKILLSVLGLAIWQAQAQTPVSVGSGSYASYPPASEDIDWNEDGVGDLGYFLNTQPIYVQSGETRPIPTNDWWTSLLVEQYSGQLWSYPLMVDADDFGPSIYFPKNFNANGDNLLPETALQVKATGYTPDNAIARDWNDWGLVMGMPMASANKNIDVTMAHGVPFVWLQTQGINPELSFTQGATYLTASGGPLSFPTTSSFVVQSQGRYFGIHMPGSATAEIQNQQYVQIDLGSSQTINKVDFIWETAYAKGYSIQASTNGTSWTTVATVTNGDGGNDSVSFANTTARYVRITLNERGSIYAYSLFEVYVYNGATLLSQGKTATASSTEGAYAAANITDGNTGTRWASDASQVEKLVINTNNGNSFFVVSALHNPAELSTYENYAFNRITDTEVTYDYTASTGKVATTWNVTTDNLKGQADGNTVQGFLPHLYLDAANTISFATDGYTTTHGTLKTSIGKSFSFTYDFKGILPNFSAPYSNSADAHPYDADVMFDLLTKFSKKQGYGGDTYWGGKDLVNYAKYTLMAKELNHQSYDALKAKTREALVNWLTYTPGEDEKFFARYDRWKAIVGFNESYGSSQFTDNHFHYGYLIQACALYATIDPEFLDDYGDMIKLVAKQYANWQRNDTFLPYLRTFDPWIGHSYAGGTSSGTGNNQESTSEAMQSWTGLLQLGDMLQDDDILDAATFGYMSESYATLEYWFDWKNRIFPSTYQHEVVGILFNGGMAYGTYFSASPVHIHGIQYLPVNPGFRYLSRDNAWAATEYSNMLSEANAIDGYTSEYQFGRDWANVALGFRTMWDPQYTAAYIDNNMATFTPTSGNYILGDETGGMTYYYTHALQNLGDFSENYRTNFPQSSVFEKNGTFSYATAYNPTASAKTCTIYNSSNGVVATFNVPAYTLVTYPTLPTTGSQPTGCYGLSPVSATATSGGTSISAAIDGNHGSRWESAFTDPQTYTLDLGTVSHVEEVSIDWEAASAKDYTVSGSTDGSNWVLIGTKTNMTSIDHRIDTFTNINGEYRYLRMNGTSRTIPYGYSIYEFEVCGSASQSTFSAGYVTLPAQIEAEDYTDMSGVQLEATADTGGGQNVGWIDAGDWMEYHVNSPTARTYSLQLRVASVYSDGTVQVRSNNNLIQTITIPNTGTWQTWQTVSANITLPAGNQTLRLTATSGFNINWLSITTNGGGARIGNPDTISDATVIYPNPAHNLVNVNAVADGNLLIYKVNGALIKKQSIKQGSNQIELDNMAQGIYFVKVGDAMYKLLVN
ncbi:glycosyl hydrolase [Flavobacterium rhizosphaerae]|uniref:glucan endo-1,3-beta-D-glucosidase n=1 Tax=Flavobacterium rhizosphaerae TaxID=3163298 RepID=A0ABW8YYN1_9FLAO